MDTFDKIFCYILVVSLFCVFIASVTVGTIMADKKALEICMEYRSEVTCRHELQQ